MTPLPWFLILACLLNVCTLHFFTHSAIQGKRRVSGWAGDSESSCIWPSCPSRPRTPGPGASSLGCISFPEGFMFSHTPSLCSCRSSIQTPPLCLSKSSTKTQALLSPKSELISSSRVEKLVSVLYILCPPPAHPTTRLAGGSHLSPTLSFLSTAGLLPKR